MMFYDLSFSMFIPKQPGGAMETPQHGIRPKSEFGSVSFFFQELSEIPQKLKSVEGFPNILGWFPLFYI